MFLEFVFVVAVGLAIGSFINVCIYRIPQRISVVSPGSRCPQCGHGIRPWENIPVLSYLWLKGRCSACREPISAVYPAAEILTALVLLLLYGKYGLTWPLLVNGVLFCIVVALVFIDLRERILPDVLTLGGLVAGFVAAPLQSTEFFAGPGGWSSWAQSLLGAFLGGGILWVVAYSYLKWRKIEGLGFGDIKMMAMVGAFLGWRFAWLTIFLGSVLGAVLGGLFVFGFRKGGRYELPFGTFLGVAVFISVLWGRRLLDWYFTF